MASFGETRRQCGRLALRFARRAIWLFGLLALAAPVHAAYVQRYNNITNGAVTFTGNTLGLNKAGNSNTPGTNGSIGAFITTNAALQDGTYPLGTTSDWRLNSSAAALDVPAGSTILYAELIWSGSYSYGAENVSANLNDAVSFTTPAGTFSISPDGATSSTLGTPGANGTCSSTIPCFYVRSANVTNLVRTAGAGTYVTGRVPATQGNSENNSNTAGWTLAVVYQNGALPSRNLTVYVGSEVTNGTITTTATVSGFCTPTSGTQSGRLAVSSLEGDPQITGDQMQFGPTIGTLAALSGPNNSSGNFFASQLNRDNGTLDTRGTFGSSNSPIGSGSVGARQGYDITSVDVSGRLVSAQTSAVARGTSTGDQYVINALGLQIQVGAPVFLVPVKAVDKAVTFVGDTLTYTIRLDNTGGTADAINVRYRDAVPAGTSFVANSFSIAGTPQPGANPTVGVDIGSVPVGRVVTVSYRVLVNSIPAAPAPAEYQEPSAWTYSFISCTGQAVSNGAITTNPVVTRIARINATKTVAPTGAVLAGQTLNYTITVNSDGTADTTGTTLRDAIPAGTSYVAGSTTLNGASVADVNGAMPFINARAINGPGRAAGQINVGESATVAFQVRVNAGFVGDVVNTATIDVDGSGAAAPITALVSNTSRLPPVLTVTKQAVGAFVRGSNGVFALAVSNAANAGATDGTAIAVSDSLPAGLTLSGTPSGAGWTCAPSGNAFSCTRSDILAPGASYPPITVNVSVAQNAPANLTNTASTQGGGDTTPATGSAAVTITGSADLSIVKSVDNQNPSIGGTVVFTLVARNVGPSDASSVVVSDLLPAGLTFISATSNLGNYDPLSGAWSVGSLTVGATAQLQITATFNGPGQVTNLATIAATETDPNPSNNSSQLTVPAQVADLALSKAVNNAAPIAGSNVTFTLNLRNAGPATATGVSVLDNLPAGLTFVSATASQGSYASGTGQWSVGSVAPAATATLAIVATVTGTAAVVNIAQVSAADQFDPNSTPNNGNPLENDQSSASVTPQGADLGIAKGVDRANPNVGDTVVFTLTVTNAGPSPANGVTATDLLPSGLTFLSATPTQGSYVPATGLWTVGAVAVGAAPQLSIRARFDGPGQVTNLATVTSPLPDPDPGNNSAQLTVPSQVADLSLNKTADDTAPNVGTNVTFTILVANAGPNTASGVQVADPLPAGLDLVSATPSQGSYAAGSGLWTVGSIASGALANLQIVARVTGSGAITNTAQVARSDQFDPNSTPNNGNAGENDQASVQLRPQSADLSVAKSVDIANPNIGDTVRFTVVVNNAGPTAAQAVTVNDRLPAGLSFVAGTASRGSYDNASGVWTIGSLAASASATLTITATFNGPGQLVNTASVTSSTPDANPGNNDASVSVPSQVADLTLSKTAGNAAPNLGSDVTFTLTLRNAGPNAATNVRVADLLPAGLSFVSSAPSQGSYAAGGGLWSVGALASGATATLAITATVTGSAPITNTAEVAASDQFDPTSRPGNGNASEDDQASVSITPQSADLAMGKSVDNPNPNIGQNVTFRLTVSNAGPTGAAGVVVNDLLPAGLTFISASASVGSYVSSTGVWSVGSLNNSQSATLNIVARFDGPTQVNNVATVTATTPDPNSSNNRSSVIVPSQIADLSLAKTASTTTPNVGSNITYTVTLRNAGPNSATGVAVGEPVPAGVSFVSVTTSQGGYNPGTGSWSVGTLASGAAATLELVVRVDALTAITNTAQVVASDQFDPNSTPNNNNPAEDDLSRVVVTPQSADLAVSKTVDLPNPNIGQQVVFTVRVQNSGPSTATGAVVADPLPPGVTFVAANPSAGSYDSVNGVWTIGSVAAGGSASLAITATFNGPGQVTNRASVSSDVPDPDPTDNEAQITVPSQIAEVSLTKTASTLAPNRGDNVTYTITLRNAGPNTATGVRVAEPLASALSFVSATTSQGNYNPGSGQWSVGSVASGASATLTIVATVTGVGAVTNVAEVIASDQFDPNSVPNNGNAAENDRASVTLSGQSVDLSIGKTVDNGSPNVGDLINYTVTVRNAGPSNATGVVIADALPAGVTFQQAAASVGSYDSASGRWTIGTVIAGGVVTLTIRVRIDVATPVTNTAAVASVDQPDSNPGNDRDSVTVPQQLADVSLAKIADSATPNVGANVAFTLTVANAGPNSATRLEVTDPLPAGLAFVAATPSQGSFAPATGLWSVGTVASGANATLALIARVTQPGPITNIAEVTNLDQRDPDATPGNGAPGEDDRATVVITGQSADLSIAKAVDQPQPLIGQNITYTLTVSNAGPTAAADVRVNDPLPAAVSFVSAAPGVGSYDAASGVWTIGTLANGATAQLRITVTYNGPGQAVNTATVSSSTPDPNTSGNSASVTVPSQIADLNLAKTVNTATPRTGDNLTFTLTLRNTGPDPATGVRVGDPLAANLQYVSSTASVGTYSVSSGVWSVGNVANGGAATLAIVARVLAAGAGSNTAQITAADQFDPNSTPNNAAPNEDDRASVSYTATGASLAGAVYVDANANGLRDNAEPGIAGVAITLTGNDVNGTSLVRNAVTDAGGAYRFDDLAGAAAQGYTVTEVQPGGYQSGASGVGSAGGTAAVNVVSAVALGAGVAATGYDFGELGSALSGSVWFDTLANRQRDASERGLANWIVELIDPSSGSVLRTARTDTDGRYRFEGLLPGSYQIRFRDPTSNVIWGSPVNGESGNPQPGSTLAPTREALTLVINPGENKIEQSLPVDPSGLLYDSVSREIVAGATVTFCGPTGFIASTQLVGGASYQPVAGQANCASMSVGPLGIYQFFLIPGAPAGNYTISVTPPAGYRVSTNIPPEAQPLAPPAGAGPFRVQPQQTPPQPGQATTHYFSLTLSGSARDVLNNHIPLDSLNPTQLLVTKTAATGEAEIGDSVAYEIRVQSISGPALPIVVVTDRLPAGFRYIAGTGRLQVGNRAIRVLDDPAGVPAPLLSFTLRPAAGVPTALPSGETAILRYRVRVGVGAQQGDGINRARAASGFVQSNEARARVRVSGGVFGSEACVVGKIYLDCNENRVQDHEEVGVPGVRLYLEDGTYLVSDVEGKYSYCGLSPTTHVLKADATTLPVGAALDTVDNRNAGDPDSRFVDLRNGELHRADFHVRNCSADVVNQVLGRRTQGEVQVPDVEKSPAPVETLDPRREVRCAKPRGATTGVNCATEARP